MLRSEDKRYEKSFLNHVPKSKSIKDIHKDNVKYQYYSKVAAGAAAICCYQAALAFASDQNDNHIFISKYHLFKSGHWPLIVKDNVFNIF